MEKSIKFLDGSPSEIVGFTKFLIQLLKFLNFFLKKLNNKTGTKPVFYFRNRENFISEYL
ncbi:hypothetical protein DHD80_02225 [Gramella sp. AN32]|nr:hypothetical protein [Gramella sp. AN32]